MKIIYRQPQNCPIFNSVGIVNCHVRELGGEKDIIATSKKEHHHTFFETHIIISGHQSYKMQKKSYINHRNDLYSSLIIHSTEIL